MPNMEKIKQSIREIAGRKQNVTLAEIERVMNHSKTTAPLVRWRTITNACMPSMACGLAYARIILARSRSRRFT